MAFASAHRDLEVEPRDFGALFSEDTFGPGGLVIVTMVQKKEEDVTMLAAPVTLQDGGVKERPQEEAQKQVVSQRQLRPIYKDPK